MILAAIRKGHFNWTIKSWISLLLMLAFFAVPVNLTAKSICINLTLLTIIFSPVYRHELLKTLTKPWCLATLFLFIIMLMACIWSPADWNEKLFSLVKFGKLLYLPVLAVAFQDIDARKMAILGFLTAMAMTCIGAIFMYLGFYSLNDVEPGGLFHNHIITGYMMAFAAYLSGYFFLHTKTKIRWVYLSLTLLFSHHVFFINNGRTGYVIYFILLILLMVQSFSKRQAMMGILFGSLLLVLSYHQSPVMQDALLRAINDCQLYAKNEKNTSIGYRLQFHNYAFDLFKRSPLIGNGTASFGHLFHQENPIPARGRHLSEPHSEYWLMASEFGLIGFLAFVVFCITLLLASLRLKTLAPIALSLVVSFVIGNISYSLLFFSATGYFFILFMALCLGDQEQEGI